MLTIIAVLLLAILIKPKLSNEAKAGQATDVNIVSVGYKYIVGSLPVSIEEVGGLVAPGYVPVVILE
jgi:hypothetical protein